MNHSLVARQFLKKARIRRERLLSQPGNVLVRSSQHVGASDVVAETNLGMTYKLLKIDRLLKVSEKDADHLLQCKPGDRLNQGDLIAGPVGIGKRTVRARQACLVVLAGDGQVLLEISRNPYKLLSVYPGSVAELIPDYGAVIESTGALIQGVWGNGRAGYGRLEIVGQTPDTSLSPADLNISQRGAIISAGNCQSSKVIDQLEQTQIHGLILGSLDVDLIPRVLALNIPVILLEGMGALPANQFAFELMSEYAHKEIALNAEVWDAWKNKRPEIFIPEVSEGGEAEPIEIDQLIPGKLVRVLRSDKKGKMGTILRIEKRGSTFCGGIQPAAEIKLQDNTIIQMSLANLEIIHAAN